MVQSYHLWDYDLSNEPRMIAVQPTMQSQLVRLISRHTHTYIHMRQYLSKKLKKWWFKVIARCRVGGFTYDFHFYDSKGPTVSDSCGFQSGDFVIKLYETLPRHLDFTVYFEDWFCSQSYRYSSELVYMVCWLVQIHYMM